MNLHDNVDFVAAELENVCNNPAEYLENMGYDEDEDAISMWFEDVLEIDVITSFGTKSYRGAQIYVTVGGPTIWIDTKTHTIYITYRPGRIPGA